MLDEPSIEDWSEVDQLWAVHADVQPAVTRRSSSSPLYEPRPSWDDINIEGLWRTAIGTRRDEVKSLYEMIQRSKRRWQSSASRFDDDPFATDWSSDQYGTGPLRIQQEENWSQWLASLMRAGPPRFLDSAFDFQAAGRTNIEREVHLPKSGGKDRYVDILVSDPTRGISIEVKRNDTQYKKTLDTAALIEQQYNREWTHYLLLPESRMPALREAFSKQLNEPSDGRPIIRTKDSKDVNVLYWRDVSDALRTVMLAAESASTHWEASAYVFCTLIEQKLAKFLSEPILEAVLSDQDVIAGNLSTGFTDADIGGQIAYLQQTMTEANE